MRSRLGLLSWQYKQFVKIHGFLLLPINHGPSWVNTTFWSPSQKVRVKGLMRSAIYTRQYWKVETFRLVKTCNSYIRRKLRWGVVWSGLVWCGVDRVVGVWSGLVWTVWLGCGLVWCGPCGVGVVWYGQVLCSVVWLCGWVTESARGKSLEKVMRAIAKDRSYIIWRGDSNASSIV